MVDSIKGHAPFEKQQVETVVAGFLELLSPSENVNGLQCGLILPEAILKKPSPLDNGF